MCVWVHLFLATNANRFRIKLMGGGGGGGGWKGMLIRGRLPGYMASCRIIIGHIGQFEFHRFHRVALPSGGASICPRADPGP